MAYVVGTNSSETLDATDGVTNSADQILGLGGNDNIYGLGGNDAIKGGGGADAINGGSGTDTVHYDDSTEGVAIRLYDGTASGGTAEGDTFVSIENASGSYYRDLLNGSSGNNVLTGLDGNDDLFGGGGNDTLNGGDGVDTISYGNTTQDLVVNLLTGIATTSIETDTLISIENASGGDGGDVFIGNNVDNRFYGGHGLDELRGGGGNDFLWGGFAGDILDGGSGIDTAYYGYSSWGAYGGAVTINLATGYATGSDAYGDTLIAIENIIASKEDDTLTGDNNANEFWGQNGDDTLKGGGGADWLYGEIGNDYLSGDAGNDVMYGGYGDDHYVVDSGGDLIMEQSGQGTDTVSAGATYALAFGQSIEILKTSVPSGTGAINLTGNEIVNTIYGNAGANTLNGGGGADTMYGGLGDDSYILDVMGDMAVENAGEGTDWVYAAFSHTLAPTPNLENLVLQGTGDFSGTGNAVANLIQGNSGNNVIDGLGSADIMQGGPGNDAYFADVTGDIVSESAGAGTDAVYATATYTLSANVENLYLQDTSNINGTGNGDANYIQGNTGINVINGMGGADVMEGGSGSDAYFVDVGGDIVNENAGQGTDAVYASVSHALAANVENLFLQDAANLHGSGNNLANYLEGNSGANFLNGGASADVLQGGAGNDTFVFNIGQANGDIVNDFNGNGAAAGDALQFEGYGPGATLQQITATVWQIDYNGGASFEQFTLANGAAIDPSDLMFI
jgi:Ca2+-binding RTX toxin-like protein